MARLIKINGEALRKELQTRGLSHAEAGRAIYKSDSYFSKVISRNAIQKSDVNHIFERFNIPPESYVIQDKPKEPEQLVMAETQTPTEIVIVPEISEEQWQRLESIVYHSITRAIKITRTIKD